MNNINWLHISDLHFGYENIKQNKYSNSESIRDEFLEYVKAINEEAKLDCIFITGDVFWAPSFYSDEENEYNHKIYAKAKKYIRQLAENADLDMDKVFIVPGNHDSKRSSEKENLINRITPTNNLNLDFEKLSKFQNAYLELCKDLGVNYCEEGKYSLVSFKNIYIFLLNTSLTSLKDDEATRLLLSTNLIKKTFNSKSNNRIIVTLAHHPIEWLDFDNQRILKDKLSTSSCFAPYLCGHEHKVHSDNTELKIPEILSGATESNSMKVLVGELNTKKVELALKAHQWSHFYKKWIKDRNYNYLSPPYYSKVFFGSNNVIRMISKATSESEAVTIYLEESMKLFSNDNDFNDAISKMNDMINFAQKEKPHYSFFESKASELLETIKKSKTLKNGEKILKNYYKKQEYKIDVIGPKLQSIIYKIIKESNQSKIGILLYSKSTTIIRALKKVRFDIKEKVILYISETSVRNNNIKFKDANDVYQELVYGKGIDIGYEIRFIPDFYFYTLLKKEKLHLILFGAHGVYYDANRFLSFHNTSGTELISREANNHNVPVYIMVDSEKFNPYTQDHRQIESYQIENHDSSNVNIESIEIEEIPFENMEVCSDVIHPNELKMGFMQQSEIETVTDYFLEDILKDKRKLEVEDETIIKYHNDLFEGQIEPIIIQAIQELNNSPKLIDSNAKYLKLEYYNGIRLFNMIVFIQELRKSNIINESYEKESVKKILLKAEYLEKELLLRIFSTINNYEQKEMLTVYPKEKLVNILRSLSITYRIEINDKTWDEVDLIYKLFSENADVSYRDSTTKNIIIDNKYLSAKSRENISEKSELENIINQIIDTNSIVDIDFSSCIHYTTKYDDLISFKFHERTFPYYDYKSFHLWYGMDYKTSDQLSEYDKTVLASTFIIRYLRFGGRKALYSAIDPKGGKTRFIYDNPHFYFDNLPQIVKYYWKDAVNEIPNFLRFLDEIAHNIEKKIIIKNINLEKAKKKKNVITKPYYTDIFPN